MYVMSLGDYILVAAIAGVMWFADHLDRHPGGSYECPRYCDVDHICYIEQDTLKTKEIR